MITSFPVDQLRKGDRITLKPHRSSDRFPAFNEMEIDDKGYLKGWVNAKEISKQGCFEFGKVGRCEVISYNTTEVVLKKIDA